MIEAAAPVAQPVEPIAYRTGEAVRTDPPAVLTLIAIASVITAVTTIAMGAWSATRAYYTAPPRPAPATTAARTAAPGMYDHPPGRVSVREGDAIVGGIGRLVKLDKQQVESLTKTLVEVEGRVYVKTPPDPTPEKIAAALVERGKLFGEDGEYLVIGQVRIEIATDRLRVERWPEREPYVERRGSSSTIRASASGSYGSVWSFERPPPPAATQPAVTAVAPQQQPPPRGPLELEIRRLAPQVLAATDAALSALLAVLLLIAGISLLRYRRRGRRLHLVWASLKLPLALAAAAGYFGITLGGQFALPRGVAPITQFVLTHAEFVTSLLVALYALLVLILLNVPPVRRYFAARPERA